MTITTATLRLKLEKDQTNLPAGSILVSNMLLEANPANPKSVDQMITVMHVRPLNVKAVYYLIHGFFFPSQNRDEHTLSEIWREVVQVNPDWGDKHPLSKVEGVKNPNVIEFSNANVGGQQSIRFKEKHVEGVNGRPVLNFSLPVTDTVAYLNGENEAETGWVSASLWGEQAKKRATLAQGQRIQYAAGDFSFSKYESTQTGLEIIQTNMLVNTILWGSATTDQVADTSGAAATAPPISDEQPVNDDQPVSDEPVSDEPVSDEPVNGEVSEIDYSDIPVTQ